MQPTRKSYSLEKAINAFIGADRKQTILNNQCVPPPIGCGNPINEFPDELSRKEYSISGLCAECQKKIFGY